MKYKIFLFLLSMCLSLPFLVSSQELTLLNVSYDPTRELYQDLNASFIAKWQKESGQRLVIQQSHGGSGKQARAVIDGLEADIVTLALAYDIDEIAARTHLLPEDWQKRLPSNSAPYTSTIVFLVRKGNPKNIKDWGDLIRPDVAVITPNPKTSGGARWNYLAAWGFAMKKYSGNEVKAKEFMAALFKNVPVLDTGARGATTTFVTRQIGDVFLSWENEALLAQKEIGAGQVDIVIPPTSILAEPPVALVDAIADKHGTRKVAQAYLEFLYTPEAQEIIGKHFYRPRLESAANKYKGYFPALTLSTVDEICGGWKNAQKKHFDDGGIFDQIMTAPGNVDTH
ncbi:MAG: sulfate ABC transporter substrate-binding protein [SAR324 cluster bacterium]|uniref:Sulfate ABC transporter substrate-binding protein n=1 Tax=SAR324 cluster bacterium TaxID=2024889 RepID=A0A7X9FSG0_9DELT|nr:sulfate ABC transporter substrate-binding protein [SAR324 cluster bacterium]